MALYDSADLLARAKFRARRPSPDESMSDANWYALLTDAQAHWVRQLATHVPEQMYTAEILTTADAGVSYDFASEPLGEYELRATPNGRLLIPGPDWDPGVDFVPNGKKIRFPGGRAKTFTGGPAARYVKAPGVIDATTEPTLLPMHARILLCARACIEWARRGGLEDPQPYLDWENELWFGNPAMGETGILGALKQQYFLRGAEAVPQGGVEDWWRFIDGGEGYQGGG